MTSYATRTQSSSEQNDLKKLKSKYSTKLTTLQELFADWSDEDLLFALDEADGVLEVAVDRISEGHATQWGEVKTKKAKKEAQQKAKAAAAATVPSTSQTMSYQKPERTYTERPKSTKARPPSTNNHSRKPATTTTSSSSSSWGYNAGQKSSSSSSSALDTTGGSWASIASTKPAHDSSSDWISTSNTTFTTTNDSGDQTSWDNEETTISSTLLDNSNKPKSWASLLKSQSKPELTQEIETNKQQEPEQQHYEVVEETWNTKDDKPVIDGWNAPIETPTDAWGSKVEEETKKSTSDDLIDNEDFKQSAQHLPRKSPVVLPNNDVALSSVDVKFGSLNLDDDITQQQPAQVEKSLDDTNQVENQSQPPATAEPTTTIDQLTATNNTTSNSDNQQQPVQQSQEPATLKKEEPTFTQPQVQQVQQTSTPPPAPAQVEQINQFQQLGQQTQQTPLGMNNLTSAYNSYLPNQHHNGMSGFGVNPMGNSADYGAYGTDAHRAAAMGYYEPSAFNNSPLASNTSVYSSRDKFGQDTSSSIGNLQGQQSSPVQAQGLHGQQMYPGMPYYPYYYMPNHYNAYQQSMYGQPMMNKNVYPNMYHQPQQVTSVSKPTTQSPYVGTTAATAATASPYALHSQVYNQPSHVSGGYDDLQQSFGLHDYQKSPYGTNGGQQFQGFLGNHLQGHQQTQQPTHSQTQSQTIDSNKNATSSQPQQHQINNYFNQQQMFNYQQYPQQQYWNQ